MTSVDLEFDQLNSTVDALRRSISNRLMYGVGKDAVTAQPRDWLHAAELAVRDVQRERKQARDRCDPQGESAPEPDDRLVT